MNRPNYLMQVAQIAGNRLPQRSKVLGCCLAEQCVEERLAMFWGHCGYGQALRTIVHGNTRQTSCVLEQSDSVPQTIADWLCS